MKRIVIFYLTISAFWFSCATTTMPHKAFLTTNPQTYIDLPEISAIPIDSVDAKIIWDNLRHCVKAELKPNFSKPVYFVNFINGSDTIKVGTESLMSSSKLYKHEIFWYKGNTYFTEISFSKLMAKYTFMFHSYGTKDSAYFAESSLKKVIHQNNHKYIWREIASYDSVFSGKMICLDTILNPRIDTTLNWHCSILVNTNTNINSISQDTVYIERRPASSIGSYLLPSDTLSLKAESNYIVFLSKIKKSRYLKHPIYHAYKWLECE